MTFTQNVKKYLSQKGYKYLGMEDGFVFFKDDKGNVYPAREEIIARNIEEEKHG